MSNKKTAAQEIADIKIEAAWAAQQKNEAARKIALKK